MQAATAGLFGSGSMHLHIAGALLIGSMGLAPLSAQDTREQEDQAGSAIVVTGQRQVERESARRFASAVAAPVEGQLARFHHPICPAVAGLKPEAAVAIVERMREVAAAANVPVSPLDCRPNVVVLIAEDGREALERLRKEGALRGLSDIQRRRVLRSEGPVRVFSDVELRNDDGTGMGTTAVRAMGVGGTGLKMQAPIGTMLRVRTASMIGLPTQQATLRTIVIFDAPALMGKSLLQIADHAAMRAIGGARPDSSDRLGNDTILSLFAPDVTPPTSLTALDLAYLKGVYSAQANQDFRRQNQRIVAGMTAER